MSFRKNADHLDFLKLLLSFYGQIPSPQVSKKFQDDVIPAVVKNSQNFLKNQGCKYISLLGVCWGGLVTQKIIATGKFQLCHALSKWTKRGRFFTYAFSPRRQFGLYGRSTKVILKMIRSRQWYLSMVYIMTKNFLQSHLPFFSLVMNLIVNKLLKLWKKSCGQITWVSFSIFLLRWILYDL